MPSCVVPTCKNSAGLKKKQDGISFHNFPADEEKKREWTEILQRGRPEAFWKPSKRTVICSAHFEEKYFVVTKCGLRRLKKDAIPNKHMTIVTDEFGSSTSMEKSKHVNQLHSPITSDSEIGDVNISDLDSIIETPREAKLRSQLRRKEIRSKKHVRLIKTLHQKNSRLKKENESLKCIIKKLKKNRSVKDDNYDLL